MRIRHVGGHLTRRVRVSTRRKLAITIGALVAFTSFMAFGTLAVFTDSQSVPSNVFNTDKVDISTNPTSALVSFSNMVPGDLVTNTITVSNAGNVQLRYAITATATNGDAKGLKDQLALEIHTTTCSGATLYSGDLDSSDGKLVGDPTQGYQSVPGGGDRSLNGGANEVLCFKVSLPLATGNAFASATTTATFTFVAEQTANNP